MNRIEWTGEMIASLRRLRRQGVPLLACSERIGVSHPTCARKARELGIADRISRGKLNGVQAVLRKRKGTP